MSDKEMERFIKAQMGDVDEDDEVLEPEVDDDFDWTFEELDMADEY